VLNQTYQSIEIICVDNGSTDNTLNILKGFASKNKQLQVLIQPIKGAPAARNMGLHNATGEFIQFLDSDDLITTDKLEKQVEFIQKNKIDIVVSDRSVYNESMTLLIQKYIFKQIETDALAVSISDIIITGNPLYKRTVLLSIGGWDETLESAQDWDLHIRLALEKFIFGYLPGFFLNSRSHQASLSANWINVTKCGVRVLEKFRPQIMESSSFSRIQVKQKIFYCYFNLAIYTSEQERYISELHAWQLYKDSTIFLRGFNKLFTKLFGLKNTIKLRSIRVVHSKKNKITPFLILV